MKTTLALALFVSLLFAGCDSTSNTGGEDGLSLRMQMAQEVNVAASPNEDLTIAGTNGTLTFTQISLIVAEFELELADDSCDDQQQGEQANDDCEEFELPPSFVDLPLDQSAITIGTDQVPPGRYEEFEFEVEDLEDDEENSQDITQLFNNIRADYPSWPETASMLLVGTFTPTDGMPQPFTVYVEAEIEIEMEFNPPLLVEEDGSSQSITIEVNPENWFVQANGEVMDLSVFDYEESSTLLEFELEIEDGFTSIAFDD